MGHVQNNKETTGGITGRGFKPGKSGNPAGRPRGLSKRARDLVGKEGEPIIQFWIDTMNDTTLKTTERLEASELLAERGWGKPAAFQLVEDEDPLGLNQEELNVAVERFTAEVVRLAPPSGATPAAGGNGTPGTTLDS